MDKRRWAYRRALTLRETTVCLCTVGLAICVLIPTLGAMRDHDRIGVSMNNLRVIFQAHVTYAGDYDGRQLTHTPDDLTLRLNGGAYQALYWPQQVPPVPLGFTCDGVFYDTSVGWAVQPMYWAVNCSLGTFRAWNFQPFHQYVNGRVYDLTFWAPKDHVLLDNPQIREWCLLDCAWPGNQTSFYFVSYSLSTAAQFAPRVHANDDMGQVRPLDLPYGHRAPTLTQARYPDLKTFMLEHYWLQNAPKDPYIPGTDVPYFFNLGRDSVPVTLFYDGQVRLMPHTEAILSDEIVQRGGGPSLVAGSDPGCLGSTLYFESHSFRGEDVSSYHIFTADGILGRDTIFPINDGGDRRDPE